MTDLFDPQFGCQYPVSLTKKWNKKDRCWDQVPVRCKKICHEGQQHCPKHHLFVEDAKLDDERKATARIVGKEFKKMKDAVLEISPLAAVNPEFKEKRSAAWIKGGYGI